MAVSAVWLTGIQGCGGGGIAIDDLPAELESTICKQEVACGGAPDMATCQASVSFASSRSLQSLVAAVKRGTAEYDPSLAAKCLNDFDKGCVASSQTDPACDQTFRGKVAVGGACVVDEECVDHGKCQTATGCTDACCAGTCVARPAVAIGGSCAGGGLCVTGAFCQGGTVCAAKVAAGGACQGFDACQAPSICFMAAGQTAGVCVMPADEGAACDPSQGRGCARSDDYCDATTLKCVKRKKPGEACAPAAPCVAYASCQANICVAKPTAGQACDATTTVTCLNSLTCQSGTCALPPAQAACTP